jgi:cobalt-zinc-cadmium efflux system protein
MTVAAHRHHPSPAAPAVMGRLRLALAGVAAVLAAELVAGLLSGSLALLGDAAHLLTDSATLGFAWFAVSRSRRAPTAEHTYGYLRTGILVALANGTALLAVAAVVAVAAVARLRQPPDVAGVPVVAVALFALVVNGAMGVLLHSAGRELSVRSAALHVLADALASAGVLVAGICILALGWRLADPVVSLGIAALIAAGAAVLLREAMHILAEATPRDLDAETVRQAIAAMPGVEDVHDLHIWSLDRGHRALSAHVTVQNRPLAEVTEALRAVETALCERFAIEHATLQPECPSCLAEVEPYCDMDSRHATRHAGSD